MQAALGYGAPMSMRRDQPFPSARPLGMRTRGNAAERTPCAPSTTAHAPVLLGYALRLTDGDRARAEDMVQETLVPAWRHLDLLDRARAPVRPWLFTVAQRVAIDAHRARRARPPEVGEAALRDRAGLDELEGTLDRIIVSDALESLSPSTGR